MVQGGRLSIYLNLKENKDIESIIETIAHELSHNALPIDEGHSNRFQAKAEEIGRKIEQMYSEGREGKENG